MARSVDYLRNARYVTYLNFNPDGGTWFHEDDDYYAFDDFKSNIEYCFDHLPSLTYVHNRWDGRETRIILDNSLAEIGVSQYFGCVSVSIRAKDGEKSGLAERWIDQIWPRVLERLDECFCEDHLIKMGTFSNGGSVFRSRKRQ